jgi:hypothetical protein
VAKDCTLHYGKTFSLVIKIDSIQILLTLLTHFDFEVQQFDVKTTFLYGLFVHEGILMELLEGLKTHQMLVWFVNNYIVFIASNNHHVV